MQESLIKDLYVNYVQSSSQSRKYYLLLERIDTDTQQLKKVINKKNKKKLQRICDDYDEIITLEADTAFADGFSFAIQLMTEAYTHK